MIKYDAQYYYNLLRIQTNTAQLINKIRWDFIMPYKPARVLDFGCGVGWFAAYAPSTVDVDTFDIMPVPQTGISPYEYDFLTMWDVLEHIPDFTELKELFNKTKYVAITVPIKPEDMPWENSPQGTIKHLYNEKMDAHVEAVDAYMQFIAPGIVAGYTMFSAIFECTYGTYVRMEHQKTFDAIIGSTGD